jgi:nucleotide-binding universal stress UspA family protein
MLSIDDILLARDFSSVSDRALRYAFDLAARTGATLHVLHAEVLRQSDRPDEHPTPTTDLNALREDLKRTNTGSADAIDAVEVVEVVRRDISPGPAILDYAGERDIDLIAMGTHGRRGPSRLLLGSVAEEVARRADQPVLTVRGKTENDRPVSVGTLRRILVPIDFSDYSREALRTARDWAALYGASLDLLHVVEEDLHPAFYVGGVTSIYDAVPDLDDKVRAKLQQFAEAVDDGDAPGAIRTHVRTGSVANGITTFVEEHDVDLVALSTHGRSGLERFFLGSVAEKVVRHVPCPVLTMKAFGKSLHAADPSTSASMTT